MSPVDVLTAILVLSGGLLCLLAGIGLVRLPDLYTRMQSATKAGTLGVACLILAVGIDARDVAVLAEAVLVVLFLFITSPVASHLIGRAAYQLGVPMWSQTTRDDMAQTKPAASGTSPAHPGPTTAP